MNETRRTLLFREVNERIAELLGRVAWGADGDFLCECGCAECRRRVTLRMHEYEAIRRRGGVILARECARGTNPPCRPGRGRSGPLAASI